VRAWHRLVVLLAVGSVMLPALALPSLAAGTGATLDLHPKSHHPTARVRAMGSGFGPSETVDIAFDHSPIATATTDPQGQFSVWFRIPRSATPGHHRVNARGETSGLRAGSGLTVTTPWRGFGFDVQGNRFNRYENVLSPSTVGGLTKQWGWLSELSVLSSSVSVVGNVAYVTGEPGGMNRRRYTETRRAAADGRNHPTSGFDLAAIDVRAGTELWEKDLGTGSAHSAPMVAHGVVYIGLGDYENSTMFAVNASTGAIIWSYDTGVQTIEGSAVVKGDRVYFSALTAIYALDKRTGVVQWVFPIRGQIFGTPALSGDLLYSQSLESASGNAIYAVDINTGLQRWKKVLIGGCGVTNDANQSPVVAGDKVYVSSTDGSLHAFDATDGEERWSFPACRQTLRTPVVAHGLAYLAIFSGSVIAVDARTGVERWSFSFPTTTGVVIPGVAGDVLYVGGDRRVVAVDA
jgi:outer membrane protein assembly factor BamB